MKQILVLALVIMSMTACSEDDMEHYCPPPTRTIHLSYDSQDNIIKIDHTGDWLQSLDWNTYVDEYNWEAANPYFGVRHDWNTQGLRVVSDTYEITGMVIESIYVDWELVDGVLYITVPTMQTYMDDTDLFYFKVNVVAEL